MSKTHRFCLSRRSIVIASAVALVTIAGRPAIASLADPATMAPYGCVIAEGHAWNAKAPFGSLKGQIYHPVRGRCLRSSGPPQNSPVVLLLHGNGYSYKEYNYLAQHLAANGFVVVSVESEAYTPPLFCPPLQGACIEDRARKGVLFLELMRKQWAWASQADFSNLGIVGHSQGGEAAVEAARIIRTEMSRLGDPGVGAVVSLAPTDLGVDSISGRRRLVGRDADAFLVLYGSRDEDIKGWNNSSVVPPFILPHATGFALYDRAGSEASLEGIPVSIDAQIYKSMQFMYGANHQRFSNRTGHDLDEQCWPAMPSVQQKHATKGFVNGFLRWWLLHDDTFKLFFDTTLAKPWGLDIYPQYSPGRWNGRRVIDNFQQPGWTSTIGGSVTMGNGPTMTREIVDNAASDPNLLHGPEDGRRLKVTHGDTNPSNLLQWSIPSSQADVASFTHLSVRIGQGYGADSQGIVAVRVRSANAWSPILYTDSYGEIPEPDYYNGYSLCGYLPDRTITHMRTIRIPLEDFNVDLENLRSVQLRFISATTVGTELYIDNLEFVGGTGGLGFGGGTSSIAPPK